MKQAIKLVLLLQFIIPTKIYPQEGFKKGFVITLNDEKSESSIKESLKSKGTIVVLFINDTITQAAIKGKTLGYNQIIKVI